MKYTVLSKMAADILVIPISTVASESTFSAGDRVVDEFRSRLNEESVEALICGGDCFRHKYGVKNKSKVFLCHDILLIFIHIFIWYFFSPINNVFFLLVLKVEKYVIQIKLMI